MLRLVIADAVGTLLALAVVLGAIALLDRWRR